jgi:signal peptidase I
MAGLRRHLGAAGVIASAVVWSRLTRYEIAEQSMEPALLPGDWVLGVRHPGDIRRGDIVVFAHESRELVKRVTAVAPDVVPAAPEDLVLAPGQLWVTGDNPGAGSIDSTVFGPIETGAVRARLVLRYRPLPPRRISRLAR